MCQCVWQRFVTTASLQVSSFRPPLSQQVSSLLLPPFGSSISECPIIDRSVSEWRNHAVAQCVREGLLENAQSLYWPPNLLFSVGFLRAFLRAAKQLVAGPTAPASPVSPAVAHAPLHDAFGANRLGGLPPSVDGRLQYGLVLHATGESPTITDILQAPQSQDSNTSAAARPPVRHITVPMLGHVNASPQPGRMDKPLLAPVEPDFVWQVGHWCDLLLVNLLALPVSIAEIPAGGERERGAEIHPTAIVERSRIGTGARVGPFALVRDAIVGDRATIREYASVTGSYVGPESVIQSYSQILDSVVGAGSVISFRTSVRGSLIMNETTSSAPVVARSVVGSQVFLSRGLNISASNLSGDNVSVWRDGERVDTGLPLLGCAIGDGAKVGGLHLPAGYEVPAGCIVAPRGLAPVPTDSPVGVPLIEHNGRLRKLHLS